MENNNHNEAVKEIRETKRSGNPAAMRFDKNSGWFFIVWGVVWFSGYTASQFFPDIAGVVWIVLNVLGIAMSVFIGFLFYGKKSRRSFPGFGVKVLYACAGLLVFDIFIVLLFGLYTPRHITILVVLSTAFCYFMIGLFTRIELSLFGFLLSIAVLIADLVFPGIFYFIIAVLCGSLFLWSGLILLLKKEK